MKELWSMRRRYQADIGFTTKGRGTAIGYSDDLCTTLASALHRGQRIAPIGLKGHCQQAVALVHADDVICWQAAVARCQDKVVKAHARDIPEVIGKRVGQSQSEYVDAPRIDHQVDRAFEVGAGAWRSDVGFGVVGYKGKESVVVVAEVRADDLDAVSHDIHQIGRAACRDSV